MPHKRKIINPIQGEQLDLFSTAPRVRTDKPLPKEGDKVRGMSVGGMHVAGIFEGYSHSGCWKVRNLSGGVRLVDPASGVICDE